MSPSRGPALSHSPSAATLARLDEYFSTLLGCPVRVARGGGVHVVAAPVRALPGWLGYVLPIVGVSYADQGAVLSTRPDLVEPLLEQLGSDARRAHLDAAAMRRVYRAVRHVVPNAFALAGDVRVADEGSFRPTASMHRAELIPAQDPAALELRRRFDGPVFGIRAPRGSLASWAALKLKSDDVWEVAVATQPEYRGRGYARDVVSAATHHTLQQGRLCLYVHDHDNRTSAFVSRALGYQLYAEIVLAEF